VLGLRWRNCHRWRDAAGVGDTRVVHGGGGAVRFRSVESDTDLQRTSPRRADGDGERDDTADAGHDVAADLPAKGCRTDAVGDPNVVCCDGDTGGR